jgi:hypothetical protein
LTAAGALPSLRDGFTMAEGSCFFLTDRPSTAQKRAVMALRLPSSWFSNEK